MHTTKPSKVKPLSHIFVIGNMRFLLALPLLLSFFLAGTVESRKDVGEYWRMVMQDQPMPEAIQGLLHLDSDIQSETKHKTDHKCEELLVAKAQQTTQENKVFAGDFEQKPSFWISDEDSKVGSANNDFEPRPNLSTYKDGEEKKFIKDFEPKPSFWIYDEDDKVGSKNNDFEPRPSASSYND